MRKLPGTLAEKLKQYRLVPGPETTLVWDEKSLTWIKVTKDKQCTPNSKR